MFKKFLVIAAIAAMPANVFAGSRTLPSVIDHTNTVPAVGMIELSFSPNGGAESAICAELDHAKQTIQVQAYSFTNPNIGKALVRAHNRGVNVRVIVDKSQLHSRNSLVKLMQSNDIPIHVDTAFNIAHSKIMVIDDNIVVTGSYNFSKGAEHSNAENNLILIGNHKLVALYEDNWQWRWDNTKEIAANGK